MCRLLRDIQNWIIEDPFDFEDEDQSFLEANPLHKPGDWGKERYKPIRDKIRNHYFDQQNGTCAYCRLPINDGTDMVPIEHIVDKSRRPEFAFLPENLVVSCYRCNTSKSTKNTLYDEGVTDYPTNGSGFIIIHGHFDNYFDNIEFIDDSIYHARTTKGEKTIEYCKLDEERKQRQREEVTKYMDDPLIQKVLQLRKTHTAKDKQKLIEEIEKLQEN